MKKTLALSLAAAFVVSTTSTFAAEEEAPSTYDKIWDTLTFIDNDEAEVVQKLALVGRLQGDAYSFQSENSSNDDIAWRRFRLGVKATLFQDFVLHSELDLDMNEADDDSWEEFYKRLTDTYLGWNLSKEVKFKVGKQSAGFTLDGATSSKKLLVPERSIVAGNLWFPSEYFTGATVLGDIDGWSYKAGGFSSSGEPELGHFESGYFALLSAGRKVGKNGSLRLDYVYQDAKLDSDYGTGTADLEHIVALVYKQMLNEKLGLWTDIATATGIDGENSDLFGIDIMPFYNFTEELQLVLQYAGVTSLDNEADVKMSRYAYRNAGKDKVETAHNLLLGFNWYLYGHKLKWQNAIEYNHGKNLAGTGDDYNGYGITSALRISW